jgi:hypothetical protein
MDYAEKVGTDPTAPNFIETLAAALGQLTQQSQGGKPPIPPALLQKRAEARGEMFRLLEFYAELEELPEYELMQDFFVDDVLIPATYVGEDRREHRTVITYAGIPNEAMEPRNKAARDIMDAFRRSIGGGTPALADQSFQAYKNRPRQAGIMSGPGADLSGPSILGTPNAQPSAKVVDRTGQGTRPRRVVGTIPSEQTQAL